MALVSAAGEADCPRVCPLLESPVCGFNGECHIDFANECQIRMLNCNEKYTGPSMYYNIM